MSGWRTAAAPPAVAMASACRAVTQRRRSGSTTRPRQAASRIASCNCWLSLVTLPSLPSATVTPAATMRAIGAMPVPSFRLLSGLCTTTTPWRARRSMSGSSIQIV